MTSSLDEGVPLFGEDYLTLCERPLDDGLDAKTPVSRVSRPILRCR